MLLDHGIIYPILDVEWVSHIQVTPKKTNITMIRDGKNNLVRVEDLY